MQEAQIVCRHCAAPHHLLETAMRPCGWLRPAQLRDDITLQYSTVPWVVVRDVPRPDDIRQALSTPVTQPDAKPKPYCNVTPRDTALPTERCLACSHCAPQNGSAASPTFLKPFPHTHMRRGQLAIAG